MIDSMSPIPYRSVGRPEKRKGTQSAPAFLFFLSATPMELQGIIRVATIRERRSRRFRLVATLIMSFQDKLLVVPATGSATTAFGLGPGLIDGQGSTAGVFSIQTDNRGLSLLLGF